MYLLKTGRLSKYLEYFVINYITYFICRFKIIS